MARLETTPSQTVGPFFGFALPWGDGAHAVPPDHPGAVRIHGRVLDGAGAAVPDALVETWQAGPDGTFAHAVPPGAAGPVPTPSPRLFARVPTDSEGRYELLTVKPGPVTLPGGGVAAPHIDVHVLARGLLRQVMTRIYFPDEPEANAADPVLAGLVPPGRRHTLIADSTPAGLRFDIRLQGERETVFFSV